MIFYRKTAIYFADRGIGCTLNASPPQNKGWGLLGGMGAFVYMNQDSARENEDDSTEKIMTCVLSKKLLVNIQCKF